MTQPLTSTQRREVAAKAAAAGVVSFRANLVVDCPFCGAVASVLQDAEVASGLPVEYPAYLEMPAYEPLVGEVLKNHYMRCSTCGADQAS